MTIRVVFMGTSEFAVPTLDLLLKKSYKIVGVYSQPPSKSKRGQKINSSAVQKFSNSNSLKIFTPDTLKSEEEYLKFKKLNPELGILVSYGKIIPKRFLDIPKYGFINLHASLLPNWRGAAPIQRSILNLDKKTGVSIMKVVEELDAGPVLSQLAIKINDDTSFGQLEKKLSNLGSRLLVDSLDKIKLKKAIFIEQDHSKASYAKKISKIEGKIEWNKSAEIILAKIKGLNPSPGAWFEYKKERYKIYKAELVKKNGKAGEVLDGNLVIACKDIAIKILEIQKQGKKIQKSKDFLLGSKIKLGTILL